MVMAFEVVPGRETEIAAALHAGDLTTRPQTVRLEVHPRFWTLIDAFTSAPAVLRRVTSLL